MSLAIFRFILHISEKLHQAGLNNIYIKITISAGIKQCDFLDVSLDLESMLYKPYHKENKVPKYVNVGSNHPKSIIKNIPLGVQERLSMTSSTTLTGQ